VLTLTWDPVLLAWLLHGAVEVRPHSLPLLLLLQLVPPLHVHVSQKLSVDERWMNLGLDPQG
jgi:hypothetical protein